MTRASDNGSDVFRLNVRFVEFPTLIHAAGIGQALLSHNQQRLVGFG